MIKGPEEYNQKLKKQIEKSVCNILDKLMLSSYDRVLKIITFDEKGISEIGGQIVEKYKVKHVKYSREDLDKAVKEADCLIPVWDFECEKTKKVMEAINSFPKPIYMLDIRSGDEE